MNKKNRNNIKFKNHSSSIVKIIKFITDIKLKKKCLIER